MKAIRFYPLFLISMFFFPAFIAAPEIAAQEKTVEEAKNPQISPIWISKNLKWSDETDSCPGFFEAQARVLYFGADGEFLMVDGSVERYPPNEFRAAEFWTYGSHSLYRIYTGNWKYQPASIEINYRLTFDSSDQTRPADTWQTSKIAIKTRQKKSSSLKYLIFERQSYRPTTKFETTAFQAGYEQSSQKSAVSNQ